MTFWRCCRPIALVCLLATAAHPAPAEESAREPRVEARSNDLLAVGMVHGERMSIRLSRLTDNAPVTDAEVTVQLRGRSRAATAEADGSYTVQMKELALSGAATVEFQVAQAAGRETLKGIMETAGNSARSEDKNSARQLWWWVLNFAVCIGFLMLISRRRKSEPS